VRLLTIHAAKGLEFKVVIVADAGRDRRAPSPDEILALSDGRFGFKVADPATSKQRGAFAYDDVRAAREAEERAERLRLYYVAMTRAIDRLIVSGAIGERDGETPIGWVLNRLGAAEDVAAAGTDALELERDGARFVVRLDRYAPPEPERVAPELVTDDGQLALFGAVGPALPPPAPTLPPLAPIPVPPGPRVRKLSFTALASFERCSYRYYAERVVGMRARKVERGDGDGVAAVDIGSAVHNLLEHLDLKVPRVPDDLAERVRAEWPAMDDDAVALVRRHVEAWCSSPVAARVATLDGVKPEQHFLFEQDDVLLHGYLDLFWRSGDEALVVDYKTNVLGEHTPTEVVDAEYRLQRLVYALAAFKAGAARVEVVYSFLEQPEAPVSTAFSRSELPDLEAALSAAIEAIRIGDFRPSPSAWACAGCPALAVVCAGPALHAHPHELAISGA
jgi:ATP-dependent exoDNAse (exonuclease V) beta subunit